MTKTATTTQFKIADVKTEVKQYDYRTPIKFGNRIVSDVSLQRVFLVLEEKGKKKKTFGAGEMTLGTSWAWPSKALPAEQTVRIVGGLVNELVKVIPQIDFGGHPLRFGLNLIKEAKVVAESLAAKMKLTEPIPELAILLACSPIDAAVHDAFGRHHQRSTFDCFGPDFIDGDVEQFYGPAYAGIRFSEIVRTTTATTLPIYHLVGASDPLSSRELNQRIDDGRPETLEEWIAAEQLTHLKIKLCGTDLDWDVGRVIEIDRITTRLAASRPWLYSLDFNEACPNEDYVIDFLERVDRLSKSVQERLQYIEQPTTRKMESRKDITMHRVSRLKPVVVDESLTGIESLKLAHQLGYSGVALKACKTITETILLAAVAKSMKMELFFQDLTCVGASFLTSASLAAHLNGITAVEGNGRQYCPIANAEWEKLYMPMFKIIGGVVPTELLSGVGLGYRWPASALPKAFVSLSK
jgi:L-alanine-DL-glutamate epimerase-like enolase superfamily enzyme